MAYGGAKVYSDGSHYIAIPHTINPKKPRKVIQEKEVIVNEKNEVVAEYEEISSTLTSNNGRVLEEVEFVDGELKVIKRVVKQKGKRISKKALFERLYMDNAVLKAREKRKAVA